MEMAIKFHIRVIQNCIFPRRNYSLRFIDSSFTIIGFIRLHYRLRLHWRSKEKVYQKCRRFTKSNHCWIDSSGFAFCMRMKSKWKWDEKNWRGFFLDVMRSGNEKSKQKCAVWLFSSHCQAKMWSSAWKTSVFLFKCYLCHV